MARDMSALSSADLPWHREPWRRLGEQLTGERLPHALLIHGPDGIGKSLLAARLTRAALCGNRRSDGDACGACRSCRLAAGAHPDRFDLRPAEERKTIGVDQVRDLIDFLGLSSQYGGYRVAVVEPAEAMTVAAANSLLKTLEEPRGAALLILVSARAAALPTTVRSRCQMVTVAPPTLAEGRRWLGERVPDAEVLLALDGGAPLAALRDAEQDMTARYSRLVKELDALVQGRREPVTAATDWLEVGVEQVMHMLWVATSDIVRIRTIGRDAARTSEVDVLQRIARALDCRELFDYLDGLTESARLRDRPLNAQLVIEAAFIDWCGLAKARHANSRA